MSRYKIGFICGFFDLLHDGHINILKFAKSQCDFLIVAVGTDEFMIERKHRESVLTYDQRVTIIKSIRYVDRVVPETDLDKIAAYKKYHFDVMFAGEDHKTEQLYIQVERKLRTFGVDTVYFPRKNCVSSSNIRKKIIEKFSNFNECGET
jgi:glycerol-3-phosphate cytidylyltransferase